MYDKQIHCSLCWLLLVFSNKLTTNVGLSISIKEQRKHDEKSIESENAEKEGWIKH